MNQVARARLDWRALLEDLVGKIRGLASERSVTLSCLLPPHLPVPEGDYHWLYLACFGALSQALREAPPLSEVKVAAREDQGRLETTIVSHPAEEAAPRAWPPPALFPLRDEDPRIGRLQVTDLAVTRGIFLLHGGDLREEAAGGRTVRTISLPV